jgi:hypothetical protein
MIPAHAGVDQGHVHPLPGVSGLPVVPGSNDVGDREHGIGVRAGVVPVHGMGQSHPGVGRDGVDLREASEALDGDPRKVGHEAVDDADVPPDAAAEGPDRPLGGIAGAGALTDDHRDHAAARARGRCCGRRQQEDGNEHGDRHLQVAASLRVPPAHAVSDPPDRLLCRTAARHPHPSHFRVSPSPDTSVGCPLSYRLNGPELDPLKAVSHRPPNVPHRGRAEWRR